MGVKLSSKETVTDAGTSKVLLVSDAALNLIDPANLPGSGGGVNRFFPGRLYALPGYLVHSGVLLNAATTTGDVRGHPLAAGDYSGCKVRMSVTTLRGSAKIGLYAFDGNTGAVGALQKDLGEVVISGAGEYEFPVEVGKIETDTILLQYRLITTAGKARCYNVSAANMGASLPLLLGQTTSNVSVAYRYDATLPYPDTLPITPPTLTQTGGGTGVFSVMVYLFRAST